jgi:glucosamine 6-phosphate synthetase-like amidotransferase/phosphosugar isomerase protein
MTRPLVLLSEIAEQPALWRTLLSRKHELQTWWDDLEPSGHSNGFMAVGEGSSYNAARLAFLFWQLWGLPVHGFSLRPWEMEGAVRTSAQHKQQEQFLSDLLYLPVSQSGKTGSLLKAFAQLEKEAQTLGFTWPVKGLFLSNNPTPPQPLCHGLFHLNAGQEQAIAATKTMTGCLFMLLLLGLAHPAVRHKPSTREKEVALLQLAQTLEVYLAGTWQSSLAPVAEALASSTDCHPALVLISNGALTWSLAEGALKLTETTREPVLYHHSENFKHGPKAMLSGSPLHPQPPCVLYIVPPNPEQAEALFQDAHEHFSEYQAITNPDLKPKRLWLRFENSPPLPHPAWQAEPQGLLPAATGSVEASFIALVGFQLLGLLVANQLGLDASGLQKAVE